MVEASHSFSAYYKRAVSPLLVLAMLRERPMYGYEISSRISAQSGGALALSVLYPVLFRLQEQEFIAEDSCVIVDGRARSYYRITESGTEYLKKTLREYRELDRLFSDITGEQDHEK